MGIYINRGSVGFQDYTNGEYVDKTGMIEFVNSTINTPEKLMCVTRPRRFGKSAAAQMLNAYYDRSSDSRQLFERFEVAKSPTFEQHLNKYPTIFIDVTGFTTMFKGRADIVDVMQKIIMKDIAKTYPDIEIEEYDDLMALLLKIAMATGEKFVMIIDEWDAICREAEDKPQLMDNYVNLLRRLFKSNDTPRVFALVYMTGILPIKRYGTQSALNDFREYSMTDPGPLAPYFGFTQDEVKMLCEKYGMDYDEMKGWYDGYSFGEECPSVFNPNSVMTACNRRKFGSYWGKTSAFETLQRYIDLNISGVQEVLEGILRGDKPRISVLRFNFDLSSIGTDDELFTLFIHLGYLTYDPEYMTVAIPNKEIGMEIVEALRGSKTHEKLAAMIKTSDRLMKATLAKDEATVAAIIEQLHDSEAAPDFYNNEQALRSVLKLGYISAIDDYVSIQELPSGKGYADLALIPRYDGKHPAVVVELKWNRKADAAIKQIKLRNYPEAVSRFTDNILLVGISYNENTKKHNCRIE